MTPIKKEKVINYIKQWLKKMTKRYPHINFKYYYEKWDDTHYIFVDPINEYLNGSFGKDALDFDINHFIKKFPNELLAFLPMEEFEEEIHQPVLFEYRSNNLEIHLTPEMLSNIAETLIKLLLKISEAYYETNIKLDKIKSDNNTIEIESQQLEPIEYAA